MKKPIFLTTLLSCLFALQSFSQGNQFQSFTAAPSALQLQVDSVKSLYTAEGFQLLKEASISMESEYEMPVVVPLTEGTWYQFVFIGEYSSKLYEVRMYDWNEKMVVYKKHQWGDIDGNVISFSYIPQFSEFHMIKPVQVNKKKKKNLDGYVMLFKKVKQ